MGESVKGQVSRYICRFLEQVTAYLGRHSRQGEQSRQSGKDRIFGATMFTVL
jgi:hypothetical protein